MKHEEVRSVIDKLVLEKGTKSGQTYILDFSIKEVLDRLSAKNTEGNQRYIRYVIQAWYDKATLFPGQGDNGGLVHLKVRSV